MKKRLLATLAIALCAIFMFPLSACNQSDDPDSEKVDPNRTQLYVCNYDGGYGTDWLYAVKKRFEEAYRDVSYEKDKMGVQIIVNKDRRKANVLASQILDDKYEVYFTEEAYYYTLLNENHALGDITDAVTADLGAYGDTAGKTILDKLSDEQLEYYGVDGSDGKKHFYGVPHYAGNMQIAYNVELFEEKGFYFKKGADISGPAEECFVAPKSTAASEARSVGPDGREGTYDDGLPATYEEFYLLCDFIKQNSCTPLLWSGEVYQYYLTGLMRMLASDFEGLQQMSLNYTLDGEAKTLGTIQNGQFVRDAQTTVIGDTNRHEIARQEGKYRALQFMQTITEQTNGVNKYAHAKSYNPVFLNKDAQTEYLFAGKDGVTGDIAMLVDGIWWQNEASATFERMVNAYGDEYSSMHRKFATMPLPKASYGKVNEVKNSDKTMTIYDQMLSLCFMKANVADWKKPLAYEFIKFVNSDASLVEFTQITNTPKALQYTMTEEQKAKMTPYGRSVMSQREHADIVYPYSNKTAFINNQASFGSLFYSKINSTTNNYAPELLKDKRATAETWFSGMYEYQKNDRTWR